MAEDGFDFHTPARRETKQFEPPPWEREAFEDLERKRAEREAQQAPPDDGATAEAAQGEPDAPQQDRVAPGAVSEAAVAQGAVAEPTAEPSSADAPGEPALDDGRVAEMLAQLSVEEPSSQEGLWKAAIVSAILLGAIGAVLIVWSLAAIVSARRSGVIGVAGGLILLFFGVGFVAGALWLTVRTLRQRGVL